MKDLEKIKSEDLAAQVQDANPANFAIEQEVAALVGATLPAPTEPSEDDARELPAQLQVFLRRALTPIRSALRTAVAAIYAHLDSRCTDYTPAGYAAFRILPYDPMTTPRVPRTLPNLLTALTAFAPRKISNGSAPNDGIPDGISLAHILGNSNAANAVTKLIDDNTGWELSKTLNVSIFPNLQKVVIGASKQTGGQILPDGSGVEELEFPYMEEVAGGTFLSTSNSYTTLFPNLRSVLFSALKKLTYASGIYERGWINPRTSNMPLLTDWHFPVLETIANNVYLFCFYGNNSDIKKIYLEAIESATNPIQLRGYTVAIEYLYIGYTSNKGSGLVQSATLGSQCAEIELKQGYGMNLNISGYNPTDKTATFLQNFKEHIALRLTANGSGKTLTLSQAVFDTIWNADGTPKSTDPDSVIYQINKIIKTDKHWSVNRA